MKEQLILLDADYTMQENSGVVLLYCKDEKGRTILLKDNKFKAYFYILPKKKKENEAKKRLEKLDEKKVGTKILKVQIENKMWQNKETKIIKITVENPRRLHDVRDAIKELDCIEDTFEYDIPFYKRYIIDNQLQPMGWIEAEGKEKDSDSPIYKIIEVDSVKPSDKRTETKFKVLAFDTEWVDQNNKSVLIMLSLAGNDGYKKVLTTHEWGDKPNYVESLEDEKELILRFMQIVRERDPDFIVGYNSDGFDIPKLKEKATELKISLKLGRDNAPVYVVQRGRISSAKTKGRVHIDIFDFVYRILGQTMKSEVLTLDEVSQEMLGVGKKNMKYKDMVEIWKEKRDLERLAEYNLWDSEITLKLSHLILPQIFALSRTTGQLPFDAARYSYSQLVESFFIQRAFVDNVLIPNRPKTDEIERRRLQPPYKGAVVIEPIKGIHQNVLVFDFRSLYPTIIVTHNIDPWTFEFSPCKKKVEVPEAKWFFCADKKGFIPKHLEEIIKKRIEVKKELRKVRKDSEEHMKLDNEQFALKTLANATYGYFAYAGAKWYRRECGSSAASFGRYYITSVVEEAKKNGFEILYGDTDSLMIRFTEKTSPEKLYSIGEKFAKIVNRKLPGTIELEFRDLYQGGIFVSKQSGDVGAKKRYALVDFKGNLEIRGFETVRRDWCELSKKIQRDVLVTILRDRDPEKAIQLVRDVINKIQNGEVNIEDLAIFEQITRPLGQYRAIGPHVMAAQKARERGKPIGEGTVIAFVITKGKGSISERAEPLEDVKSNQYDPDYYVEHQILPASMRVLKALGYSADEVKGGKIQKKLDVWTKK
jgi:DNA polymerase elongation subunit (family B)